MIRAAVVVELLPVAIDDVGTFLRRTTRLNRDHDGTLFSTWDPVIDHLRQHPLSTLADVLSSPLMAAMARQIYSDIDANPRELLDGRFNDRDILEGHLLDAFTPAAFGPAPLDEDTRQWDAEDAQRWITFLAHHLDRLNTGRIAWWRLETELPAPVRLLSPGIMLGIATLPVALIIYLTTGYPGFLALAPGFAIGVPLSLAATTTTRSAQTRWHQRIVRQILVVATAGLIIGLLLGATQNFINSAGLEATNTADLVTLLAFGLLFGVAIGIIFGTAGIARQPQPASTTIWSWHQPGTRPYRFTTRFLIGFAVGLVFGESVLGLLNIDPEVIPPFNVISNSLNFGYFGNLLPSLTLGIAVGLFSGLTVFATRSPARSRPKRRIAATQRRRLIPVMAAGTVVGVVFWLTAGLAAGAFAAIRKDAKGDDFPPGGSYHSLADGERYTDYPGAVRFGRLPNGTAYITFGNMTVTFYQNSDGNVGVDVNPPSAAAECDGCLAMLSGPITYTSNYDVILPDGSRITPYGARLAPNGTTTEHISDYGIPADISWLDEKPPSTLFFNNISLGLYFGLAFGLVAGIAGWLYLRLDVPADVTRTISPSSSLTADRAATFVRSLIMMLLVLIFGGIAAVNVGGTTTLIWAWIPISLAAMSVTAWWRMAVARAWLATRRQLPWRLMSFLDWAHNRGVLRQAGAVYEFRHARVQQRLVERAK